MQTKFFHTFWSSNLRFFLLLGPCGVITLVIGGHAVAVTAVIGLVVAYLLDALGLDFMGYISLWFTVIASIIAICSVWPRSSNSSLLDMFILLNFTSSLLLLGLWSSLQSVFFIKNFPDLNSLFERVLSGCLALPCTGVLVIGGLPFCGIERAAYLLCLVLFIALKTSFTPRDETPEAGPQNRTKEKPKNLVLPQFADPLSAWVFGIHLVTFQFLPMAFHFFLHKRSELAFFGQDLILLLCLPLLMIHFAWDEIWDYHPLNIGKEARVYLVSAVGLVTVGALEYRIVASTLAPYLYHYLSRPWLSWVLVTTALYAAGAAVFLFHEFLQKGERRGVFYLCVHVAAQSASLALGIPWYLLPLPSLAAYAFLRVLDRFELIPYIAFVCVSMLVMTWFAHRSFWFLDVNFGPLSLRLFALILVLLGGVFLLAPGTLILRQRDLSDIAFLAMAVGLSLVEFVLFQQNSEHDTDVYPSFLIWLTTVVGVAVAAKLRGLLKGFVRWLVIAILVSKCAISFTLHPSELTGFFLLVIQGGSLRSQMRPPLALVHLTIIFCGLYLTRRILLSNILNLAISVPSTDLGVSFPALATVLVGLVISKGVFRSVMGVLSAVLALLVIQTNPLFTVFGNPELIWVLTGIAAIAWLCIRHYPSVSFLLFGACAGLTVCELSVPVHGLVYAWYVVIFLLFTGVFLLLRRGWEGIPLLLTYFGCMLILPVVFLDLSWLHGSGKQNKDALYAAQMTLIGTLACLHFLISLYVKLFSSTDRSIFVGNSAAIMTLLLGLLLRWGYQGGSELCVVVLSPVLLLLSHGYNRYYPLWVAVTSFLAFVSVTAILALPFSEQSIELFCLLGALPIVVHSTLSNVGNQDADFWLVCLTPLGLLGLFLTSLWPIRFLALAGVGSVPVVWHSAQSIRRKGMNIL